MALNIGWNISNWVKEIEKNISDLDNKSSTDKKLVNNTSVKL